MKIPVTLVSSDRTVVIDVEPAVYNRALKGAEHFQSLIIDLTKDQLDLGTDVSWDDVEVGQPASRS